MVSLGLSSPSTSQVLYNKGDDSNKNKVPAKFPSSLLSVYFQKHRIVLTAYFKNRNRITFFNLEQINFSFYRQTLYIAVYLCDIPLKHYVTYHFIISCYMNTFWKSQVRQILISAFCMPKH